MIEINKELLSSVTEQAALSERKRKNYNFHTEATDTLQRMLNALQPGTYVQPHKHENPDKREAFIILTGKVVVVEYSDKGEIIAHAILSAEEGNYGVDLAPRIYHSLICLEPNSVVYELKDGPYDPVDDKNFASWAPKEGDEDCADFIKKVLKTLGIN